MTGTPAAPYSGRPKFRTARVKNTSAKAITMPSSAAIDSGCPKIVTVVGKRSWAAFGMDCAENTTSRNGAIA